MTVEIKGLKRLQGRLSGMEDKLKHNKKAMSFIGQSAWREVVKNFDDEKDSDGKAWPKWSKRDPKTGKRKFYNTRPTQRGGSKLLQDTGNLRQSNRWKATDNLAMVFNKVKYAKYHDKGTKFIPKRKFMWIGRKARKTYADFILKYIVKG